jgi:hypothetical protein
MSLQKNPLYLDNNNNYIFNNNKEFLIQTEGFGIKCNFCNSKVFYGYVNWKSHLKSKKHQNKTVDIKSLSPEEEEIKKLKMEIKKQKIITVQEANKCEVLRNSLSDIKKELKILKKEIEKKFKIKNK